MFSVRRIILVVTLFFFYLFLLNNDVLAEASDDGCVTWDTYCIADTVTADLNWRNFSQTDVNDIRGGCALQSVSYTVTIFGEGSVNVGSLTNYSWSGLSPSTAYNWEVTSNYQCAIGWGTIDSATYSFTTTSCNRDPDNPDPTSETWDRCLFRGISSPTFHWDYLDLDGDPQQAYEILIDVDATFKGNKDFECGGEICTGGDSTAFAPNPVDWDNWADWNETYYWKVRVQDSQNNWSVWSTPNAVTTFLHANPFPLFSFEPLVPVIDEVVTFNDYSVCYNNDDDDYLCQTNPATRYQWDFNNDSIIDCDSNISADCRGNATTTYTERSDFTVTLSITDDIGSCNTSTVVGTSYPLPEYQEVPPIIWLRKTLVLAYQFLMDLFRI